ncbi:MAG: 3-hydroxyacyl-ACP dehydratase FabZ [Synergistaceae bacterium]|nr:3-hydroxyacyl-ACP dehydratase FabZ [Synergistaceae bacterium]
MKYDINKIMELLPHRYPFLLVDRIEDLVLTDDLVEVTGIKNVTINEPFFQGHFPDEPVMPGVLVIESMGQVAAVLLKLYTEIKENERRLVYVTSIDKVKFRRPVKPGDQLKTVATLVKRRGNNFKFKFRATIDGDLAAEGMMGCVVSSGLTLKPEA